MLIEELVLLGLTTRTAQLGLVSSPLQMAYFISLDRYQGQLGRQ
jgi:hypothetical protein